MGIALPVPNYPDYLATIDGDILSEKIKGKIKVLKPNKNGDGYLSVVLSGGKPTTLFVHRLVMYAFKGISKLPVDHINFDRSDNRLENLRYITHKENCRHSYAAGRYCDVEKYSQTIKLDKHKVLEIRKLGEEGVGPRELGRIYGVSHTQIRRVLTRENWKNV